MKRTALKRVVVPPLAVVAAAEADYEAWEARRVALIYAGTDGDATRALFDELCGHGVRGRLAMHLFRAQKCTARAAIAVGTYRDLAVGRKKWALEQLADCLRNEATYLFGWAVDPEDPRLPWVLIVDLPNGQVRFHTAVKGNGPPYPGEWEGSDEQTLERVLAFVNAALHGDLL